MLNGRVTTSYLRLGERTELEQPDGSPAYVLSSRDGDAWVAVDDEATFEIRRWMDGDMLRIVRPSRAERPPCAPLTPPSHPRRRLR